MENNKMALQLIGNMFTVKADLRDSSGIYEVADENGILAELRGAEDYEFFKGRQLKCNVISTEGARPLVVLAEKPIKTGSAFSISPSYLQSLIPDKPWRSSIVDLLLYNGMQESFETRAYAWVITHTEGLEGSELNEFLCDVRGCLINVMEKSELLMRASYDEVDILNDRLGLMIEHTGYVRTALKAVLEGNEDEYVSEVIYKLCESGFLYHPKKTFCVLTYIFRMHPQVMEDRMEDLMRAIRSKKLGHWKKEPFRTELIKQLEVYVCNTEKKALYDDVNTWACIFEALAIQLLMVDAHEELIDVNLNLAKMCRAGSFFRYASQVRMADMGLDAIQGLLKNRFVYSLEETGRPEILYHKMENWYRNQEINRGQVSTYNAKGLSLEISGNSITVYPGAGNVQQKAVLSSKDNAPKLWHDLDIMLEKGVASRMPSIKRGMDRMSCLKKIWSEVEDGLFDDTKRLQARKVMTAKTCPKAGDVVLAYVYRQEDDNTFRCMVSDDKFFGQGLISVRSDDKVPGLVSYFPIPDIEDFRSVDGNPLLIRMKVAGIEPDGTLIFDAKGLICDYIKNNKPYFVQRCIVGKAVGGSMLLAVTEGGFPVYVEISPEDREGIAEGDHIEVTIDGSRWFVNGFVQGRFLKSIDDGFTVGDAFYNLVSCYAEGELKENSESDIKEVNLDKNHVVELLNILDRLATMEHDSDAAYCYVGFAAAVALLIGDEGRAAVYRRHMELLYLLHRFAVTDAVDVDELAQLQSECLSDECPKSLRRLFYHLLIVSYMGKDNAALGERLTGVRLDETQEELKGYVYSYNVLLNAGLPTDGLKSRIKHTLNLTGREGYVKTYEKGESQTVEFKTSILYPAGTMRGNLRKQTDQILKEVCAFLNRDGGKLYLGVNDYGVGVGLEEDMKFELFSDSRDKYDRYVRDQIAQHLGQSANHCINSYFDDDACGRDVYVLEIQPCETAVSLYGEYYERQGSSSRKVGTEYLDTFLRSKALGEPSGLEKAIPAYDAVRKTNEAAPVMEKIATGCLRNNVLHCYEPGYEFSEMYLHFLPEAKFKICKDDTYEEDMTSLSLNLHAQDVDGGCIVTVYGTGEVSRVPVALFLEKPERKLHGIYNGQSTPLFICPARKDDILYMAFEHKGTVYHRLENVSDLKEGGIRDAGEMLFDVSFDRVLKAEVLPASLRDQLPKVVSGRKKLGNFWKTAETDAMLRLLSEKGV